MARRTLKVFRDKSEQGELARQYEVIERYESFLLIQATAAQARRLAEQYPVEDITDLYKIGLPGRTIDTNRVRIDAEGKQHAHPAYQKSKSLKPGKHHYLVQFLGPIKQSWIRGLKRLGAEPRSPLSDFTYVVRCDGKVLQRIAAQKYVRWVGHLPHPERIHLQKGKGLQRTRIVAGVFNIEFFDGKDMRKGAAAVRKLGAQVLAMNDDACLMTVRIDQPNRRLERLIDGLSAIHGVRSIRRRALKRPSNDVAARIMNTDDALSSPLGLSGQGEVIAVCDTGLDTGTTANLHPDFRGRVKTIRSYPITPSLSQFVTNPGGNDGAADLSSGHGTHVAGSALGSGASSRTIPGQAPIRGLAYKAQLVFQAVEQEMRWKDIRDYFRYGRYLLAGIPDDLTALFTYAYNQGARIHSNSWGGGAPGEYDAQCRQLDGFVWRKKDFCILVAAGNDGTDFDSDGQINMTSVTSPATAKNCITIGASENLRPQFNSERYGDWWPDDYPAPPYVNAPMANSTSQVVAFSSRGPTLDGRIKPDVIGPGTFVLSTRSRMLDSSQTAWAPFPPHNHYFYMGGTSMATPLAAGAVAVVREFLRKWVGYTNPSAALLKACLVLGAKKLPGYSPSNQVLDFHQGYGRIDIDAIVDPPAPGVVYFLDDPAGLRTGQSDAFSVQVRSSGAPLRVAVVYSDFPGDSLVNNLNLILTDPTGRIWVGNGDSGGALTPDTTNNVEVAHVKSPRTGTWTLRVVASNVPAGPQAYAFALSGDVRL